MDEKNKRPGAETEHDMNEAPFKKDEAEQREKKDVNDPTRPDQGRAEFHTGSTTQGGSNHGQGSSQLGGSSYKQGDAANAGTNYENEAGRLGEEGTQPERSNASPSDASAGFAAHMTGGKQDLSSGEKGGGDQRSGGGATGYDVDREQHEIKKEQEQMHNERDLDDLNIERGDPNTNPDTNPGRDNPATPGTTG